MTNDFSFRPFNGTRYDRTRVNLANVVAPPYDVISPEQRDGYYEKDPFNVIRLELNRDADPYGSAKTFLSSWKAEHVLNVDEAPAFYVYYQMFHTPNGELVTREGVLGRLRLTPYSERKVLPHERTLAGPKKDRLQLLGATRANLSPIFGLVSDPTHVFENTLQLATVNPAVADIDEILPNGETVRHVMWKLHDEIAIDRLQRIVSQSPVIIADGHHRYETSLAFSEQHPELAGADPIMIFIANVHGEGTVVLPTHRLLHSMPGFNQYTLIEKLRESFELVFFSSREEGMALLERDTHAITLIELPEDPKWVLVRSEAFEGASALEKLPPYRLQEEILKPIVGLTQQAIDEKTNLLYPHTLDEVDALQEEHTIDASFLLRAVRPDEMEAVVQTGDFMPQKSTFFYPKLLTGLVFHEFTEQQA